MSHIQRSFPALRDNVERTLREKLSEMQSLGEGIPDDKSEQQA
jgi:hypothetical protein